MAYVIAYYFRGMRRNYKFYNESGLYFVSFATIYWLDIFIGEQYLIILSNSFEYCKTNKGMELYAYCLYLIKCIPIG